MKRKVSYYAIFFCIIFFGFGLILFNNDTAVSIRSSLQLCINSVIPSLFPFFIVSNMVINLRFAEIFQSIAKKFIPPLFSVGSNAFLPLFLGIIGGYPIGASACASAYKAKLLTKHEAERLLAFCNNCSPAFIIGAVGCGIFNNPKAGILLFIIHIMASFSVGVVFKFLSPQKKGRTITTDITTQSSPPSFSFALTDSVFSAIKSSLSVCAYVSLFAVITQLLRNLMILPALCSILSKITTLNAATLEAFFTGILEFTSGIYALCKSTDFKTAFICSSILLGWGGLSVHAQAQSCVCDCSLTMRQYFFGKFLHGLISGIYALIVSLFMKNTSVSVFSESTFARSNSILISLPFIILTIVCFFCKKEWKKAKK